jgi:hypothetical protein
MFSSEDWHRVFNPRAVWHYLKVAAIPAALFYFLSLTILTSQGLDIVQLLILIGILSSAHAIDDFFLIHDRVINERICFAFYAVCAGLILLRHYRTIMNVNGFAFLAAGFLLASSIAVDISQFWGTGIPYQYSQILEEACKFVGAASWLYFCIQIVPSQHLAEFDVERSVNTEFSQIRV